MCLVVHTMHSTLQMYMFENPFVTFFPFFLKDRDNKFSIFSKKKKGRGAEI